MNTMTRMSTVRYSNAQCWYAARTGFGQELRVRERLERLGVEHFIPSWKRRDSRGRERERAVVCNLVFIRATKQAACGLKTEERLPVNYLFDYARHTMLTVPDKQMEDFMRVLEVSIAEGGLVDCPLALGERVRVTRGALRGVEGKVLELRGRLYVVVDLCGMVYARAKIPRAWLERV